MVNTGSWVGFRAWPNPTGSVIGGNHRSHCAIAAQLFTAEGIERLGQATAA